MSDRLAFIIDDEPARVALALAVLQASGAECVHIERWSQATARLAGMRPPDVVVVGYGALAADRAEAADVADSLDALGLKTLLLCTLAEDLELEPAVASGFDARLVWPFRVGALIDTLNALAPGIAVDPLKARTATTPRAPVVEPEPERQQRLCWVVDIARERIARLQRAFEAADTECVVLGDWGEVSVLLQITREPDLVVVAYEVLAAAGGDAVWAADAQLKLLDAPSVLVFGAAVAQDVAVLRQHATFARYVRWPDEADALVTALDALVPGVVAVDEPVELPALSPRDRTGEQQGPSWLDLDSIAAEGSRRFVVTIPSLSSGRIAELPVPRLLYFLELQRRSGLLRLRHRDRLVEVALHDGALVDDPRGLDALAAALTWPDGSYTFDWAPLSEHGQLRLTPVFNWLHDTLLRVARLETVLPELVASDDMYPVSTTLVLARTASLVDMPRVRQMVVLCTGRWTLETVMRRADVTLDDLARVMAFCLFTDLVTFVAEPTESPVGISYRLHRRLTDVGAHESAFQPRTPAAAVDSGNHRTVKRGATMYQIDALKVSELHTLEALEAAIRLSLDDPYQLFGVRPGAGVDAVEAGYEAVRARYAVDHLPPGYPAPVRVTAQLLVTALRDAYHVLISQEADAARGSGVFSRAPEGMFTRPRTVVIDTTPLTESEAALLVELDLRLTEFTTRDPYDVFDLWPGCGQRQVARAFVELKRRHSPAHFASYSAEPIRKAAAFVYSALLAAYQRLLVAEPTRDGAVRRPVDRPPTRGPVSQQDALEHAVYAGRVRPQTNPGVERSAAAGAQPQGRPAAVEPGPRQRSLQLTRPPALSRPATHADGSVRIPAQSRVPRTEPPATGEPSRRVVRPAPPPPPARGAAVGRREVPGSPATASAPEPPPAREPTPAEHFQRGQRALSRRAFDEGRQALAAAVAADGGNGLYHAWHAWAEYLCDPDDVQLAVRRLKQAMRIAGGAEMGAFFAGTIAMSEGRLEAAERFLKRAQRENPDNVEIQRTLRLARMRREAAAGEGKGSLLDRLFNKS